ncbi:hypothetical protein [Streptacidiphilus sp. PAMC 29251]
MKIAIPFVGEIAGEWEPDDAERRASWELYVELVTRIAVVPLKQGEGSLREAMTSMYSLFAITRDILRRYGPQVAPIEKNNAISFGSLAVAVLNDGLRPFLSRWHPRLSAWEASCPPGTAPVEHEHTWPLGEDLRTEMENVRTTLVQTARYLGQVAGATDLIDRQSTTPTT